MKGFREMNKEEIMALDGKLVIELFNDFNEKVNNELDMAIDKPFPIITSPVGNWYTNDDGLYIVIEEHNINTVLDLLCNGYAEAEAKMLATNDKVTVTSIYRLANAGKKHIMKYYRICYANGEKRGGNFKCLEDAKQRAESLYSGIPFTIEEYENKDAYMLNAAKN